MINSFLLSIGKRHKVRQLSSALLVLAGVLVYPLPLVKAGGVASGEPELVAQARGGAQEVPAQVTEWRQQVQALVQQGKFNEAIPLQQQDLAWTEKTYGLDHPDTATSLNNLATLYRSQGAYAKAEPLYLRALAIKEKALGPDHPSTATSLNNLAALYRSQGAYAKAEPLYLRALAPV